jgi:hypothetical protein
MDCVFEAGRGRGRIRKAEAQIGDRCRAVEAAPTIDGGGQSGPAPRQPSDGAAGACMSQDVAGRITRPRKQVWDHADDEGSALAYSSI